MQMQLDGIMPILLTVEKLLHEHHNMPGVLVSQCVKEATVTARGKEIYLEDEIGASISIPRNAVTRNTHFDIAASFSGPYAVPEDVKSVSPAYAISTDEKVEFSKDATVRMHHTANIQSLEDSDDLVLLVADATPTDNRYEFRVSLDSRVECFAGRCHFGVVKMKSLFPQLMKIGRRKKAAHRGISP